MKYSIWKWIRRILKVIIFFLGTAIFITILFFLGLIDYQTSQNLSSSIGYLFGQLLFIWGIIKLISKPFRTPKQPRCQTCKRQLSEVAVKHTIKKSKLFKNQFYELHSINEYRCHSESCYPKNETFEGKEKIDYVFMNRRNILNSLEHAKLKITNIEFLDIK